MRPIIIAHDYRRAQQIARRLRLNVNEYDYGNDEWILRGIERQSVVYLESEWGVGKSAQTRTRIIEELNTRGSRISIVNLDDPFHVLAPFNFKQMSSINQYQLGSAFHPYTCKKDSNHRPIAYANGLFCDSCNEHVQDWVWDWTANDDWRKM